VGGDPVLSVRRRAWLAGGSERADVASVVVLGVGYLVAAVGLALTLRSPSGHELAVLALLVIAYGIACRTAFNHEHGTSVPTEPVFVGMLLLTPLALVPLAVMVGQFLEGVERGPNLRTFARAALLRLLNCWHCIGPVVVLMIADLDGPRLSHWPVYVGALAAQFAVDLAVAVIRQRALGIRVSTIGRPLAWTFAVDATMAVIGLCAVLAADGSYAGAGLVAVPIALTWLLAHDRRALAEHRDDLGQAVESAREEARIDALTGLGNRRAWYEAIDAAQSRVAEDPALIGHVLTADLNRLKAANDRLGHDVGDALIRSMADAITAIAPPGAAICRIGGDEFALVHLTALSTEDPAFLAGALRAAVAAQAPIAGVQLSAAIGVAACPPERSFRDAFRRADQAVVDEKRERRSQQQRAADLGG
jgi:diguanylate cyclase (GGDEF)-like protein